MWQRFVGSKRILSKYSIVILVLGIGILCFINFTRLINHPFFYNLDEPDKVQQVIENKPNFKHPLLLINGTRILVTVTGAESHWEILLLGRTISALAATGAVMLLMILLYYYCGLPGALTFAFIGPLSYNLLVKSHVMKEEALFLFGVMLVFVSFYRFWKNTSLPNLVGLAVSVGVASACKYPALLFVPLTLMFLHLMRDRLPRGWVFRDFPIGMFLKYSALLLLTFSVLNYQMVLSIPSALKGLLFELNHVSTGHGGMMQTQPYLLYFRWAQEYVPPMALFFSLFYVTSFLWRFRQRTMPEYFELTFLLLFLAVLFNAKMASLRYYLVPELLILYFAVKGVFTLKDIVVQIQSSFTVQPMPALQQTLVTIILASGMLLAVVPDLNKNYAKEFNRLRIERALHNGIFNWIQDNLPPTTTILQENKVQLPDPEYKKTSAYITKSLPHRIITVKSAADAGTMDELVAQGITYVAICNYQRYFESSKKPILTNKKNRLRYAARKQFYKDLFNRGKLVWSGHTKNGIREWSGDKRERHWILLYELPQPVLAAR
jgi:hypothetical protein